MVKPGVQDGSCLRGVRRKAGLQDTIARTRVAICAQLASSKSKLTRRSQLRRRTSIDPCRLLIVERTRGQPPELLGRWLQRFGKAFRISAAPPTADEEVLDNEAVLGMITAGLE